MHVAQRSSAASPLSVGALLFLGSVVPWGVGCSSAKPTQVSTPPSSTPSQPATQEDAPQASGPNILVLISDDHSVPDLGCYGNDAITSPNLDALARRGVRFTRAYAASPQCSPSRSAIVTGRTPHATRTSRLHSPLRNHTTVFDSLKKTGYYVGAYRKIHLGDEVEERLDFRGDDDEPFAAFFERRPSDRPFFLQVGFHEPHRPYEEGVFDPPHDPEKVRVPHFLPDTPKVRRDIALYYDAIAKMDAEIGEIMKLVEQEGLTEDTFVVFAGDHGMPFPGAKGTLYEPGSKTPMIASWPGRIPEGEVNGDLVSLVDLAPTWLEAAGVEPEEPMEGRSLLARLGGSGPPARDAVFTERNWHDNFDPIRAVTMQRYKLIQSYFADRPYEPTDDLAAAPSWESLVELEEKGELSPEHRRRFFAERRPEVELYDLEEDARERNNLADDEGHADARQQLEQRLTEWMKETNDFLPPPLGEYPGDYDPSELEK